MSVAPHAGVIDFGTFTPPTASLDGIQGEVPKPLIGQENYVLTGNGWSSLGALGSITYQGTWNASTNTPTLTSSVGTQGYYYVVSVAGTTDLNGITTWDVGDWAIFNGATWQKVEGGATGTFTNVITPQVTARTDNLTLSAISTGAVNLNTAGGTGLKVTELSGGTVTTGLAIYAGTALQNSVYVSPVGSGNNSNLLIGSKGIGNFHLQTNTINNSTGTTQALISHTASAVNYVQLTGAATGIGNSPIISAQGSDAAINLSLSPKAGGQVIFYQNGLASPKILSLTAVGGAVNYLDVTPSTTNTAPKISPVGTDTNISMAFQPKGTGAIDLAAGSSGVNISNGGTVTAITRTAGGSGYTGLITATISAPTTAGGVQATVAIGTGAIGQAIVNGGTGYTVGNILTISGGTVINAAPQLIRVDTVSSGVITGISVASFGQYTTLPANPVSVTGGSGSGATFNLSNFSYVNHLITNAGSGYIEQPTVTFSGGGGSGAAAYATVGGQAIVKSIGSVLSFSVAGGEGFRVTDSSPATSSAYWNAFNGSGTPILRAVGTGSGYIQTASAVPIQFGTNGATEQLRVFHTASAVNYVQVTGGATASAPVISAQGSDANVEMQIRAKGTGNLTLQDGNGFTGVQIISRVASGDSFLTVQRDVSKVNLAIGGAATNADITLTPKGTGNVRFGTYTAGVLTPTGYIEIKDSGGTVRRLLVG